MWFPASSRCGSRCCQNSTWVQLGVRNTWEHIAEVQCAEYLILYSIMLKLSSVRKRNIQELILSEIFVCGSIVVEACHARVAAKCVEAFYALV